MRLRRIRFKVGGHVLGRIGSKERPIAAIRLKAARWRRFWVGLALAAVAPVSVFAGVTSVITFPSGHNHEVQIESSGSFGSTSTFRYVPSTGAVAVPGIQFPDGTIQRTAGGGGGGALSTLSDVLLSSPSASQALLFNGSKWVNAAQGTNFSFSVASFSDGQAGTIEIGVGTWKAIGALSFSASYNNGPATGGYVSFSGWSNLTLANTFQGPTISVTAANFPGSPGGTNNFTLNATNGTSSPTSTLTHTFNNDRYCGVSTTTVFTGSAVQALGNADLVNAVARTFTVTAGAGQYLIYSYPSRLGTATFTVGGFAGGFNPPATVSITNASGYTENYYVYRSVNTNLGLTTVVAN